MDNGPPVIDHWISSAKQQCNDEHRVFLYWKQFKRQQHHGKIAGLLARWKSNTHIKNPRQNEDANIFQDLPLLVRFRTCATTVASTNYPHHGLLSTTLESEEAPTTHTTTILVIIASPMQ